MGDPKLGGSGGLDMKRSDNHDGSCSGVEEYKVRD